MYSDLRTGWGESGCSNCANLDHDSRAFPRQPLGNRRFSGPTISAQSSYTTLINQLQHPAYYFNNTQDIHDAINDGYVWNYWAIVGSEVQRQGRRPLSDNNVEPHLDMGLWLPDEVVDTMLAPPGNEDSQFQRLTVHYGSLVLQLLDRKLRSGER